MKRIEWEALRMRSVISLMDEGLSVAEALRRLEIEVPSSLAEEEILNRCPACGYVASAPSKLASHIRLCG